MFSTDPIRKPAREQIGERLDETEADDEREDHGIGRNPELFFCQKWHNGAFESDHAADEGVDKDQECELLPVLAQSEPN